MEQLPIVAYEAEIVNTVLGSQVTVIAAETGAGKSTRVPLMLMNAGLDSAGQIGITQPRRIAAMSVATYVAELHGTELGTAIGYQIMGERRITDATAVKFMTEGILLREIHHDPLLRKYEVVIVDEAHERGVNQDLILALMKRVVAARPDLKLVIMSATIDEQRFADYFGGAPIVKVPGRVFPVSVSYLPETPFGEKVVGAAVKEVASFVRRTARGDILVFMPDEQTIKKTCTAIEDEKFDGCRILPLYGSQAPDEQRDVFRRTSERRIIVATNIAETSITIDGVVHVVDTTLIKAMQYVSASMSSLQVGSHSQAGCAQRAGRAGRTQAGSCVRLMSEPDFQELSKYTEPEIQRMSLDAVLIHLRVLGYSTAEVKALEFLDPPGEARWDEARERLVALGALDRATDVVTDDGRRMERLPVAPMLARMVLTAERYGCVEEIATIVAGLTARSVFVRPRGKEKDAEARHAAFKESSSDALTVLRVYNAWRDAGENGGRNQWASENFLSSRALRELERNRDQILGTLEREGVAITSSEDPTAIRKAVAAGLIVNLCKFFGMHQYAWHKTSDVFIHPGSALFKVTEPHWMVCGSVVETTKRYARDCTAIDARWLDELIPKERREPQYELRMGYLSFMRPRIIKKTLWMGMTLSERELDDVPEDARAQIPADELARFNAALAAYRALNQREVEAHEQRKAKAEPFRARIALLRERIEQIGLRDRGVIRLLMDLDDASRQLEWGELDKAQAGMGIAEVKILRLEEERRADFVETEQAWQNVLLHFPVCPLCGGAWKEETSSTVSCRMSHDVRRLIPLDGSDATAHIGSFMTDRNELVASVTFGSGVVTLIFMVARRQAWNLKRWKTITFTPHVAILPAHLAGERDQIIRDLADLRRAREELEAVVARIKDAESRLGSGALRRLTFKVSGGLALAEDRGVTYQAAFQNQYPEGGETWYCRIGQDVSSGGRRLVEVYPEFKLGSIQSAASLDELRELIAASYPGLPQELLRN